MGRLQWHVGDAAVVSGHTESREARSCHGCDGTSAGTTLSRTEHHFRRTRFPLRIIEDHCAGGAAGDQCTAVCDARDAFGGAAQGNAD